MCHINKEYKVIILINSFELLFKIICVTKTLTGKIPYSSQNKKFLIYNFENKHNAIR